MTENSSSTPLREVVGLFTDKATFEKAVFELQAIGIPRSDLSVLTSHESLDVVEAPKDSWRDAVTGLVGELRYEGPLVAAGLIALAAGPTGAAIAALVAAGIGGAAVKELLDEVTARPHAEHFARALAAGSIILWAAVADDATESRVKDVMTQAGGSNVHTHSRAVRTD